LDKKIIGVLLIAILTVVLAASLSYVFSQPNPNQNNPSPTPTPTPTPTPSPSEEPTEPAFIPSVPEFTLKFVNETSSLFEVNPSLAEEAWVDEDFFECGRYIEVRIKNQKVSPTSTRLINHTDIYYKIRVKAHNETNWVETLDLLSYRYYNASDSDYTTTVVEVSPRQWLPNIPPGGAVDVQVKALIGQISWSPLFPALGAGDKYDFVGEESGWSSTQTIKVP
jgi:hypothetical protein